MRTAGRLLHAGGRVSGFFRLAGQDHTGGAAASNASFSFPSVPLAGDLLVVNVLGVGAVDLATGGVGGGPAIAGMVVAAQGPINVNARQIGILSKVAAGQRTVTDVATSTVSSTITSAGSGFGLLLHGMAVSGPGIPANTLAMFTDNGHMALRDVAGNPVLPTATASPVTLTFNESLVAVSLPAATAVRMNGYEYVGVLAGSPLDAANASGTSGSSNTSSQASSPVSTAQPVELIVATCGTISSMATPTWSGPFAPRQTNGSNQLADADLIATSAGSYSTTCTLGVSTKATVAVAAFKAA